MDECADGCADLAVGPRSGAEGSVRRCRASTVEVIFRASLVWELRHPFGNPEVLIVL